MWLAEAIPNDSNIGKITSGVFTLSLLAATFVFANSLDQNQDRLLQNICPNCMTLSDTVHWVWFCFARGIVTFNDGCVYDS